MTKVGRSTALTPNDGPAEVREVGFAPVKAEIAWMGNLRDVTLAPSDPVQQPVWTTAKKCATRCYTILCCVFMHSFNVSVGCARACLRFSASPRPVFPSQGYSCSTCQLSQLRQHRQPALIAAPASTTLLQHFIYYVCRRYGREPRLCNAAHSYNAAQLPYSHSSRQAPCPAPPRRHPTPLSRPRGRRSMNRFVGANLGYSRPLTPSNPYLPAVTNSVSLPSSMMSDGPLSPADRESLAQLSLMSPSHSRVSVKDYINPGRSLDARSPEDRDSRIPRK